MLIFSRHPKFSKEGERLAGRSVDFHNALRNFEKLCQVQFHASKPQRVISPGKLHHLFDDGISAIWKVELAVKNVRSNHSPRIWFAIRGETVIYLCAASHTDNYEDDVALRTAKERMQDFL